MLCRYCKQRCKDNFVRKGTFVAHIPCLSKARDKQVQTKVVVTTFKECCECQKNCHDNHVTYKGYWFHPTCLGKRLVKTVGTERAKQIIGEVFP